MLNKKIEFAEIVEPDICPCCQYPLEKITDQLFCKNSACPAQIIGKIQHFAKTLGIKGLGPKTVEKLQLQELTELFYLDKEEVSEILGEKIATKLLDEIERSKVADFATVLESFSIPLVGSTASKKLSTVVSTFNEITKESCIKAGLGNKVTENLLNWLETEYKELEEFLPFKFSEVKVPKKTGGKLVCITGKLKSFKKKADAEGILAAAGYTLVDSVTKQTDFLIDEGDSTSSKKEKAIQYGITIITDLNDLLKENTQYV
jgi:NAD-dependent DNA ligase